MTGRQIPNLEVASITTREHRTKSETITLAETADFPYLDPWSTFTRGVIERLAAAGQFAGKDMLEAGIGDARNPIAAGFPDYAEGKLIGIDLDAWRLDLAEENLGKVGVEKSRRNLVNADVIDWVNDYDGPLLNGWGIACLPQAPRSATQNDADGYVDLPSLDRYRDAPLAEHTIDTYGLTLNAAFLDGLRAKVDQNSFQALVVLSDRVPEPVLHELFEEHGWGVVVQHKTPDLAPIQQDPDTGVKWVEGFDDGARFWAPDANGLLTKISARAAESRRVESLLAGLEDPRDALELYHHLNVFQIRPVSGK